MRLYGLLLLFAVLTGCASGEGIPPPGGPPDKTPPTVREMEPVDGTINFSGDQIEITFNEYLQESGVSEQIVITPIPERPPEIDWSGKTLEIRFRDPLAENRTYAITLGAGLTDLSGNRLGSPVTLRFSTGPIIDSGRIAGTIFGVDNRKAFVFAWLVPDDVETFNDTINFEQTPPDFIAPVADNGSFSLEALPPGRYRLVAVTDEFTDRAYSPGTDAFGLAVEDYTLLRDSAPLRGVRLRLGPAPIDLTPPQLFSASPVNLTRTDLRFSEPIDTATIRPEHFLLTTDGREIPVTSAWRSPFNALSVIVIHDELPPDGSGEVVVSSLRDTNGLGISDTARSKTFTTTSRRDTIAPLFRSSIASGGVIRLTDTLSFQFDERVTATRGQELVKLTDTASGKSVGYRLEQTGPGSFIAVSVDTTFNVPSAILSVDLGGFSDPGGYRTDTVWQTPVTVKPLPQRGTLQGKLIDSLAPNTPHVILLFHTEDKREYRVKLSGTGAWEIADIPSGNYRLTAFRDTDGDGIYSYGSLTPYRPGEVFAEYAGTVQVRARWTTTDVDIEF